MAWDPPPLPQTQPDWLSFQIWWQQVIEDIKEQITGLSDAVTAIQTAQAAADAAAAAAATAQATASASMPEVPPTTIVADYAGTVAAGQLPRSIAVKRFNAQVDVTATSAWSATVDSGSITYTIGAGTGIIEVTGIGSTSIINAVSVRDGVTLARKVTVNKQLGDTPPGSGGGSSSEDTALAGINSASMAAISDELTVVAGSGGIVTLSANLEVYTASAPAAGQYPVYGIWQWDSTGAGAWVDLGTEDLNDYPAEVEFESGSYFLAPGYLSVPSSKTGLVAASSHKFRLMARNDTGTRAMTFAGSASAVGS